MTEPKPRQYWLALCTFNNGDIDVYHCQTEEFDYSAPAEIVNVIEYSAYDQANARIKELEANVNCHIELNVELAKQNVSLKAQVDVMREAVELATDLDGYYDAKNYKIYDIIEKARETIAKVAEIKGKL